MTPIGKRFELWQSEFVSDAYEDQIGVTHDAYVVRRKVIVTVVETKATQSGWSGETHEHGFWIAKDEAGTQYTQLFDETGMWGRFHWADSLHNSWHLPTEGIGTPYINPDGTKAVPQVLDA